MKFNILLVVAGLSLVAAPSINANGPDKALPFVSAKEMKFFAGAGVATAAVGGLLYNKYVKPVADATENTKKKQELKNTMVNGTKTAVTGGLTVLGYYLAKSRIKHNPKKEHQNLLFWIQEAQIAALPALLCAYYAKETVNSFANLRTAAKPALKTTTA